MKNIRKTHVSKSLFISFIMLFSFSLTHAKDFQSLHNHDKELPKMSQMSEKTSTPNTKLKPSGNDNKDMKTNAIPKASTENTTSQDTVTPPSVPSEIIEKTEQNSRIEKIRVTGSRIKQINVEGPSPTIVLDKKEMEKTGYNSVSDVLRDSNSQFFWFSP